MLADLATFVRRKQAGSFGLEMADTTDPAQGELEEKRALVEQEHEKHVEERKKLRSHEGQAFAQTGTTDV